MGRVTLQSSAVIPAQSEILTIGNVEKDIINPSNDIVIEPMPSGLNDHDTVLIAATLCSNEQLQNGVPVRIMNTSMEDVTLCEGQTIGFASAVVDVQQVDNTENDSDVIINRIRRLKSEVRHTVNLLESSSTPPSENLHSNLNELYEKKFKWTR